MSDWNERIPPPYERDELNGQKGPVLKLILGEEKEDVRWHSCAEIAYYSRFFDAALGGSMMESQTREFVLEDIDGETWDDMLRYVMVPLMAETMTTWRVIDLARHYDKYDFENAIKLCDAIVERRLRETMNDPLTTIVDSMESSQLVAVAFQFSYQKSKPVAREWLYQRIHDMHTRGRCDFGESDMRSVQPALVEMVSESEPMLELLHPPDGDGEEFSVEDVQSVLFPAHFVTLWQNFTYEREVKAVYVTGCRPAICNGYYRKVEGRRYEREFQMGTARMIATIYGCRTFNEWKLCIHELGDRPSRKDYFRVPCMGRNNPLPPLKGWILDDHAGRSQLAGEDASAMSLDLMGHFPEGL